MVLISHSFSPNRIPFIKHDAICAASMLHFDPSLAPVISGRPFCCGFGAINEDGKWGYGDCDDRRRVLPAASAKETRHT